MDQAVNEYNQDYSNATKTLTLNKAIDIARTEEATSSQLQDIRGTTTIDSLRQKNSRRSPAPSRRSADDYQHRFDLQHRKERRKETCSNCGTLHDHTQKSLCPAFGTKCLNCGKFNHWRKVCRSGKSKGLQRVKHTQELRKGKPGSEGIHSIAEKTSKTDVPDMPQLYFNTIYINNIEKNGTQAMLKVQVDSGQHKTPLLCKIDTGAEGNVIPVSTYKRLCPLSPCDSTGVPLDLTPSTTRITAFGGHPIEHYGTCKLTLSYDGHSNLYSFHVVNTAGPTILGLPTCTNMKLITLNYSLQHESNGEASTEKQAGSPEAKEKNINTVCRLF